MRKSVEELWRRCWESLARQAKLGSGAQQASLSACVFLNAIQGNFWLVSSSRLPSTGTELNVRRQISTRQICPPHLSHINMHTNTIWAEIVR